MAINTNIGEQAVQATFQDRVLVGMLAPQGSQQKLGYSVLPSSIEWDLTVPTTGTFSSYRCDQVGKQILPYGYTETKPLYDQSVICVLHPESKFDETNPQMPNTFIYDKKEAHYVPTAFDVHGSDQALWILHDTFIEAEEKFKAALEKNQKAFDKPNAKCPEVNQAFAHYEVARRNFETAIQCREHSLAKDETTFSEFFTTVQATAATHTSAALFKALAPKTHAPQGENVEVKAARCMSHYEAIQQFLEKQGRYCSEDVKEELLGSAVFALQDALKEAPIANGRFSSNVKSYLSFQKVVHQFSRPMTNQQFRTALVQFLFNKSEAQPSEKLKRAAALNPDQKRKLEEMIAVKQEAITSAKRNLIKRGVRATILSMYDLQHAIGSMLSDRRFMGVEEIIRKALKKSDGWIPSRPFEDFLPDDDKELEELTRLSGISPQEVEARKLAMKQVAFRTRMHLEQAFEKNCHGQLTLGAALLHTAQGNDFDTTSGYFNTAREALEQDVYGRMQRLGTMDHSHPDSAKTRFVFAPQPAGKIYSEYSDAQLFVDERLGKAAQNLFKQLDTISKQEPNDRFASLNDDVVWLEKSLPSLETTAPGRPVTRGNYPKLSKINKLKPQVQELSARVENTIRMHRLMHPITTAAQRGATFAPTTAEIRGYLDGFSRLNLTEGTVGADDEILEEATSILESSQIAAMLALEELNSLVKITPSQRAPLMRELYEAFFELNNLITHDITDNTALEATNIALERALDAYKAVKDAHLA